MVENNEVRIIDIIMSVVVDNIIDPITPTKRQWEIRSKLRTWSMSITYYTAKYLVELHYKYIPKNEVHLVDEGDLGKGETYVEDTTS